MSKACWEGDHQTVESLLKAGVSPNQPDRYGAIPIISASSKGHGKVVQILIVAGADVNAHEDALDHRFTAIGEAKALKQPHVVDILRAAGAIE